jgi:hypothetical protein
MGTGRQEHYSTSTSSEDRNSSIDVDDGRSQGGGAVELWSPLGLGMFLQQAQQDIHSIGGVGVCLTYFVRVLDRVRVPVGSMPSYPTGTVPYNPGSFEK